MFNNIDAVLSAADYADVLAAIQQIQAKMPFLQGSSELSRKNKGWVMSVKARVFCEKVLVNAENNTQYISPNIDLAAYRRDCALKSNMHTLLMSINTLQEAMADTYAALQTETAQQALYLYKQLKMAADSGHAEEAIVAELKTMLPRQGKRKKKAE